MGCVYHRTRRMVEAFTLNASADHPKSQLFALLLDTNKFLGAVSDGDSAAGE